MCINLSPNNSCMLTLICTMLMIKRSEVTCIKGVGISEEMSVLFVKDVHRDLKRRVQKDGGIF